MAKSPCQDLNQAIVQLKGRASVNVHIPCGIINTKTTRKNENNMSMLCRLYFFRKSYIGKPSVSFEIMFQDKLFSRKCNYLKVISRRKLRIGFSLIPSV